MCQAAIQSLFRLISFAFYRHVELKGGYNLPPDGVPTLLCITHTNGLADAVVSMAKVPRFLRICAKDTLWKHPVFGPFIEASGAIPVMRAKEHGSNTDNTGVFRAVSE